MIKRIGPPKGSDTISAWGTRINGEFTGGASADSFPSYWKPTSSWCVTLDKQKPVSGTAIKDKNGWRRPTNFRAYSCRMIPGPAYEYRCHNVGSSAMRTHRGERGFLPGSPYDVYLGTTGAGRFPMVSASLHNRAIVEAMNKLKDSGANVAESVATLDKTFAMIAGVATTMRDIWLALHAKQRARQRLWDKARNIYYGRLKGPYKSRRSIRKKVFFASWGLPSKRPKSDWYRKKAGSAWLELMYGWKPLINDLSLGLKAVKHGLPKLPVTAIRNVKETNPLPFNYNPFTSPYAMEASGSIVSGCKVRIDTVLTHPHLATLDSLGLINPFQLGWELLPFSFVIDWILPIGHSLTALSSPFGLSLKGFSVTDYSITSAEYKWTSLPYVSGVKKSARIETLSTERKVSSFWPMPGTFVKSPFTNLSRAATALSLLQQLR